jgi:NADH:ubiquinone oxidoreductase subunit 6 (subunit J)
MTHTLLLVGLLLVVLVVALVAAVIVGRRDRMP